MVMCNSYLLPLWRIAICARRIGDCLIVQHALIENDGYHPLFVAIAALSLLYLPFMIPTPNQNFLSSDLLERLRQETHSRCVVCSPANLLGLKIEFSLNADGSIQGQFFGNSMLQGYDGMLHGGVIAALLDGAMTNCLFAHGFVAVTAELKVRYHQAVTVDSPAIVCAWRDQSNLGMHQLYAELTQNNCIKARASAKFMQKPGDEVLT